MRAILVTAGPSFYGDTSGGLALFHRNWRGAFEKRANRKSVGETRWDENAGLQAGCDKLPVTTRSRRNKQRRPAMRKSITVAGKQTRIFAQLKHTVGLDLGDRWSWYCVLDEGGEVVFEQKLSTTPKALREVFGAMPHSRVAMETGTHSPWVSRLMKELGHEVIVAQARKVRLIGESRK